MAGRRIVEMVHEDLRMSQILTKQAFENANMTPADFEDAICRQFDTLYREGATSGRVMHIALHPYLTGVPYRIGALDAALKYICKHKKVWKATGSEIARHYRAQSNAETPAQKKPARKKLTASDAVSD